MRYEFVKALESEMKINESIYVLLGDLGFGIFDQIRKYFPERCINVGSSEQLMMGIASGMSLEGKIPVCYSISSFLIYRPFEFIRNYIDHESLPVKLVGSGRNFDYGDAGFTHHSAELSQVLDIFSNIQQFWPESNEEMLNSVPNFLNSKVPAFMSLRK